MTLEMDLWELFRLDEALQVGPHDGILCSNKNRSQEFAQSLSIMQGQARWCLSASQEEKPHQKPTLLGMIWDF